MATRISTLVYRLQDEATPALKRIAGAQGQVGTSGVGATAGVGRLSAAMTNAERQATATSASLGVLRGALQGVGMAAVVGGVAGVVAGVVGIGKAALSARGQMAAFNASLEAMLGSQEAALALSKQVTAFADATPFRQEQVQQATQQLLSFGFAAEELIPILTSVGGTVARFGDLSNDKIQEVVRALGLMREGASGAGESLEILRQFGISRQALMAEGIRFKPVTGEFMNIPANRANLLPVVLGLMAKNQEQLARQAKELPGLYSTFQDSLRGVARALGAEMEPAAKAFLVTATQLANHLKTFIEQGGLRQLGAVLSSLVPLFKTAGIFLGLLVSEKMVLGVIALARAMTLLGRANIWLLAISIALQLILSNAGAMAMLGKLAQGAVGFIKMLADGLGWLGNKLKEIWQLVPLPIRMWLEGDDPVAAGLRTILPLLGGVAALALIPITVTLAAGAVEAGLAGILAVGAALVALPVPILIAVGVTIAGAAALAALGVDLAAIPRQIGIAIGITLDFLGDLPTMARQVVNRAADALSRLGVSIPTEFLTPPPLIVSAPNVVRIGTEFLPPPEMIIPRPAIVEIGTQFLQPPDLLIPTAGIVTIPTQFATPPPLSIPTPAVVTIPTQMGAPGGGGGGTNVEATSGGASEGSGSEVSATAEASAYSPAGTSLTGTPSVPLVAPGPDLGTILTGIATVAVAVGEVVAAVVLGRRAGPCFAAGTPVATPDGPRPIESLAVDDAVLCWDFAARAVVVTTITETFVHAECALLRLDLEDGSTLSVTRGHLLYADGYWHPAGDCQPGTSLQTLDGGAMVVQKVQRPAQLATVYNLHVAHPDHTYFANGVLVHNFKSIGMPFAEGGIVTPRAGGTPAIIGEGGEPEAVIPLSRARDFGFGGGAGGSGVTINLTLAGGVYATEGAISQLTDEIAARLTRGLRMRGGFALTQS